MATEAVRRLAPVGLPVGTRVDPLPKLRPEASHPSPGNAMKERADRQALSEGSDRAASRSERDETLSRLFDEHYRGLCRLAGLLLGDSAAAEEVVQEAFLRTFSGWWRVRHPERAQWYLRTSVVNLCRSRQRRRTTEDRGNRMTWSGSVGASGVSCASEDEADRNVEAMNLVALVRRLPPRQRDAVVLRYYEDLPEAEIARILGCAVGTVKSQLSKARATLASALAEGTSEGNGTELATKPEEGGSGA
jgi:RNA polymerase sigma-70 factor (sigma-E family)